MSTETKLKLLLVFSLLCLTGLLVQGYFLWQVQAQLVADASSTSSIPQSVQERLDANWSRSLGAPRSNSLGLLNQQWSADPFAQMQQQLDSMFNMFAAPSIGSSRAAPLATSTPTLALTETESEYLVSVETSKGSNLEINTQLEANLLTVRGSVTEDFSSSSNAFGSSFVSRSQFTRTFDLPKPVDELAMFTETNDDGLIIHVPKK